MADYKNLYFHLFGCLSDILEELEQENIIIAREKLINVMLEAEEKFMSEEEKD